MTRAELVLRLRVLAQEQLPVPAGGATRLRHARLVQTGRDDLSLAKLAEAHWDAIAILAEAGREPAPGLIYAVWASELPGIGLSLSDGRLNGVKQFCTGIGLADRALVTVREPAGMLLELDLAAAESTTTADLTAWASPAFADTATGTLTFHNVVVQPGCVVGVDHWYTNRPGFWHGACGPAACWAGGAAGLVDYAARGARRSTAGQCDPHTLAHLGAMAAEVRGMEAILEMAADAMDATPADTAGAHQRALVVRHLVDAACTRILTHFSRALGPRPLALDREASRRFAEVELFIRQSHAERDLQQLGDLVARSRDGDTR